MNQNILPLFVRPVENELFSSWIYRLATSNHCTPGQFHNFILHQKYSLATDIDFRVTPASIQKIALITSIDFNQIKGLTLKTMEGRLFPKIQSQTPNKWVLRRGYKRFGTQREQLQYCPKCNNQFFDIWSKFILFTSCTDCGSILITNCQNCAKPINFLKHYPGKTQYTFEIQINSCYYCKQNISEGKYESSPTEYIQILKSWKRMLLDQNQESVSYFNLLYTLAKFIHNLPIKYRIELGDFLLTRIDYNDKNPNINALGISARQQLFFSAGIILPPNKT